MDGLPKDNDKYYVDNKKEANVFKLRKYYSQSKKSDLFTVILNLEKKLARAKIKLTQQKLKRLLKKSVKMLQELGQEYVEI